MKQIDKYLEVSPGKHCKIEKPSDPNVEHTCRRYIKGQGGGEREEINCKTIFLYKDNKKALLILDIKSKKLHTV